MIFLGETLSFSIGDRFKHFLSSHPASSFPHLIYNGLQKLLRPKTMKHICLLILIYALASVIVEGRTPVVLLPVYVHSIIHTVDPIFGFKFG